MQYRRHSRIDAWVQQILFAVPRLAVFQPRPPRLTAFLGSCRYGSIRSCRQPVASHCGEANCLSRSCGSRSAASGQEPSHTRDTEVFAMNDRIWTPPHLLALRSPATRYDCSRISGLSVTSVSRGRATMGYSRVGSSLVTRASRPWSFPGYSDAGSTCSPSLGMLATVVDGLPLIQSGRMVFTPPCAPVRSSFRVAASPRPRVPSCSPVRSLRHSGVIAPRAPAPSD